MSTMAGGSSVPFPLQVRPLLLLVGTQLILSTSSNLSSEFCPAKRSLGSRCGPGEYWSARRCCQCCPAGEYVKESCSSPHTQGDCKACKNGTYTGHANGLPCCLPCTTCRDDQEMVSDCTPTQNRKCQCKTGEYYCDSEDCLEGCHPCTRCPKGKVVLQACNATADTLCGLPGPGKRVPVGPNVYVPETRTTSENSASYGSGSRHRFWWMAGWLFAAVAGALVILCARKPGDGGGRATCCYPHAGPVSTGHPYRRDSLESSVPFVSSPETPDADAPVPTTGALHLPEGRLDVASEPLILPGTPESPAGDGPRPEAEAGDEAGPQAGHHDLTLLHPPCPPGLRVRLRS